jgi:predicted DNA-binding WGR domain protein
MRKNDIILYGERRDPRRNMARFYALEITGDLLGGIRLERRWGRIGQRGRLAVEMFPTLSEAQTALEAWRSRKFSTSRNSYRPPASA